MDSLHSLSRLYLKYCERCGGLWLRPEDADTPYCPACRHLMAQLPARAPRSRRKPRLPSAAAATASLLTFFANASWEAISWGCA